MSDSSWPHGLQHTRLPCPSLSPGVCSNSCLLSQWCCLTISFSAALFSFCLQSFPASGSFPVSQLSASGGQSIRDSASVLPMNIQGWFPLGLTGLISLSTGLFKRLLPLHSSKASILWPLAFFMVQLSHPYITTGKTIALVKQTSVMPTYFSEWQILMISVRADTLFLNLLAVLQISLWEGNVSIRVWRSQLWKSYLWGWKLMPVTGGDHYRKCLFVFYVSVYKRNPCSKHILVIWSHWRK